MLRVNPLLKKIGGSAALIFMAAIFLNFSFEQYKIYRTHQSAICTQQSEVKNERYRRRYLATFSCPTTQGEQLVFVTYSRSWFLPKDIETKKIHWKKTPSYIFGEPTEGYKNVSENTVFFFFLALFFCVGAIANFIVPDKKINTTIEEQKPD